MSYIAHGRGSYGNRGMDREQTVPPSIVQSSHRTYVPSRGGFDHPNVVRPMSRDIQSQSASRAPYGEPIENSSVMRNYPDLGSLSLNDDRSRGQDNSFPPHNGRNGPPAPPAGLYDDAEDGGTFSPLVRPDTDIHNRTQNRRLITTAFSEGRQPPLPSSFSHVDSERPRDPNVPMSPPLRTSERRIPPPPGYNSLSTESKNVAPPLSVYNRTLDPRIDGSMNQPSVPGIRNVEGEQPPRSYSKQYPSPTSDRYPDERLSSLAISQLSNREPAYGSYNAPSPASSRFGASSTPRDSRDGFDRQSAYSNRRDPDDRYDYGDRHGPLSSITRPTYGGRGSSYGYDTRRSNGYSNNRGCDDHRPYNAPPSRGGYSGGGGGYGGSSGGYGGGSRGYGNTNYGRTPINHGYGSFDGQNAGFSRSANNEPLGSGGRFANIGQNTRFDRSNYSEPHPIYNQKERAPRDYIPRERTVEEVFADDQKHSVHDGAFLSLDADIEVSCSENLAKVNCEKWDEMELHPTILENINKSGYTYPRKIQQYTIPYVFDGFDIMCQGETGSGKTAAFLIPTIHKFLQDKESGAWKFTNRPYCLIISPTRELANQLYVQAKKFAYGTSCVVERAYGEISVRENIRQVSKCDILIGCVGRLMHFMTGGDLQCQDIKMLIIDEADRLFGDTTDQKFFEIFGWLPDRSQRQTLLFSATLQDRVIQALANEHMKPDCINIMAKSQSNSRVIYLIYAVENEFKKVPMLIKFLQGITMNGKKPRCLVFVNQKTKTDQVAVELTTEGFPATTIHGDRSQNLREEALSDFQEGKVQVLVATDVCARGVDIYDMDYVVNMDLPRDKATYIQRCGRTGRLREGHAVSFYHEPCDRLLGPDIAAILENSHQPSPEFLHRCPRPDEYGIPEGHERETPTNLVSQLNVSASSPTSTVQGASVATPMSPSIIHDSSVAVGW